MPNDSFWLGMLTAVTRKMSLYRDLAAMPAALYSHDNYIDKHRYWLSLTPEQHRLHIKLVDEEVQRYSKLKEEHESAFTKKYIEQSMHLRRSAARRRRKR